MMNLDWYNTEKLRDGLYVTREHHFFEGNRCNIYSLKGPTKDVIIDTGIGVCDLRDHLQSSGLIDPPGPGRRESIVICTHNHFDHVGGAHQFEKVYIHEEDLEGLRTGRQVETLNYVKNEHFYRLPYQGYNAMRYRVPKTPCNPLRDGDKIDIGGGEYLEVLHFPGHSKGSIALYYPTKQELFSGDVVYECGDGGSLLDWLPTSDVNDYINSANRFLDWMAQNTVTKVYPGHFDTMSAERTIELLSEYAETKDNPCSRCCTSCLQYTAWIYILFGCFRCCPC